MSGKGSGQIDFNVRNASTVERGGNIPPRNRHGSDRPVAEVDDPGLPGRGNLLEDSVLADQAPIGNSFEGGQRGPPREAAGRPEPEGQSGGRGESVLQVNRQAVRWDDVETDAGERTIPAARASASRAARVSKTAASPVMSR